MIYGFGGWHIYKRTVSRIEQELSFVSYILISLIGWRQLIKHWLFLCLKVETEIQSQSVELFCYCSVFQKSLCFFGHSYQAKWGHFKAKYSTLNMILNFYLHKDIIQNFQNKNYKTFNVLWPAMIYGTSFERSESHLFGEGR